jgi:hypothetical protein
MTIVKYLMYKLYDLFLDLCWCFRVVAVHKMEQLNQW